MGSIFAEKALYGSDAVITNPAKSGRALGSAFRGMRTASCDFIFGTARSSAVQDRSRNKRPPQSPSASLQRESGFEAPFPLQAIPSDCMNSSAYECAGPSRPGEALLSFKVDSWQNGVNRNIDGRTVRRVLGYNGNGAHFRRATDEVAKGGSKECAFG